MGSLSRELGRVKITQDDNLDFLKNKIIAGNGIDIASEDGKLVINSISNSYNNFTYNQNFPSLEWTVNHNLNKYPSVTVVDSGNNIVIGDISYIDKNTLNVRFSSGFAGKVYCN